MKHEAKREINITVFNTRTTSSLCKKKDTIHHEKWKEQDAVAPNYVEVLKSRGGAWPGGGEVDGEKTRKENM